MPRKIPTTKLVLWDDLHVGLYGPVDIQNNRTIRRRVNNLIDSFGGVIRKCMRDCAKQVPVLKRFRVKVQS